MFGIEKSDPNVTKNRKKYVGGSDVPTILGINQYKTQYELALEKCGIVETPFISNSYITFGNVLEPMIRDYINATQETFFHPETYINEEKAIRANVDGYCPESHALLEIKTHGKNPNEAVYEAQMQLYMYMIDTDLGYLAMYERPEDFDIDFDPNRLTLKEIKRNDSYIKRILEAIETFWIRCEFLKDNPEMSETEYLTNGTPMQVTIRRLNEIAPKIIEQKQIIKSYENKEKELKELLYEQMTDDDIKKIDTPNFIITRVLPGKSQRFDSKQLKEDHPDIYTHYVKETERKGYIKLKVKEKEDE